MNIKTINKFIPISVIGASNTDEKTLKTAFKVGQLIASNKGVVICGGLSGIMESVCKGAKSKNGIDWIRKDKNI